MKIDLTKEEWEFLRRQILGILEVYEFCGTKEELEECLNFFEKIGTEWVDDE